LAKFEDDHPRELGDPGLKKRMKKPQNSIRKQGTTILGGLKSICVVPRQTDRISIANMC